MLNTKEIKKTLRGLPEADMLKVLELMKHVSHETARLIYVENKLDIITKKSIKTKKYFSFGETNVYFSMKSCFKSCDKILKRLDKFRHQ